MPVNSTFKKPLHPNTRSSNKKTIKTARARVMKRNQTGKTIQKSESMISGVSVNSSEATNELEILRTKVPHPSVLQSIKRRVTLMEQPKKMGERIVP